MNTSMLLPVIDPKYPFQTLYQPVIQDLLKYLKNGLQGNLHSIYLFGSIARKQAVPGRSNLDVVVVLHSPLTTQHTAVISSLKWRCQRQYPHLTGLSINFGLLNEIMTLESIVTWGFMLKHCCVCIHGDDLSSRFGAFEPSWEIAKNWNMDVEEWLILYRAKIVKAKTDHEQISSQISIAKKLLRATYSLVMNRDKFWYDDPIQCGQVFLNYYPEKEKEIQRLVILLTGKKIPKRSVIGLLDNFGRWIVNEFKKIEFKIG